MRRTKAQKKAYSRNFTIMSLRGIFVRLGQMGEDQEDIKLYCGDMRFIIDKCLEKLGAETQTDRLGRKR